MKLAIKAYEEDIINGLHKDLHKAAAETYVTEIGFLLRGDQLCNGTFEGVDGASIGTIVFSCSDHRWQVQ